MNRTLTPAALRKMSRAFLRASGACTKATQITDDRKRAKAGLDLIDSAMRKIIGVMATAIGISGEDALTVVLSMHGAMETKLSKLVRSKTPIEGGNA